MLFDGTENHLTRLQGSLDAEHLSHRGLLGYQHIVPLPAGVHGYMPP